MPWAAAGAVVSAGAGLLGASQQAGAAKRAQDQAQKQFQYAQTVLAPWENYGQQANTQAANLLGLYGQENADKAMQTFQQSPGYQWSLDQGLRAIDANKAATGMLRSGATDKAVLGYATGLANQEFSQYYNRLFDMAKLGESAATMTGQEASSAANAALAGGNALSSIYGNAASGISNSVNSLLSNPNFQNWAKGIGGSSNSSIYNPPSGYGAGGQTLDTSFNPLKW